MSTTSSTVFIGAGRFRGYWDASTNTLTVPSGLEGITAGTYSSALESGGYATATGLTPAVGDYLQVTVASASTTIDENSTWRINDWVVYTGSTYDLSVAKKWLRLDFENTAAQLVFGDMRAGDLHVSPSDIIKVLCSDRRYISTESKVQLQKGLEICGTLEIRGVAAVNKEVSLG